MTETIKADKVGLFTKEFTFRYTGFTINARINPAIMEIIIGLIRIKVRAMRISISTMADIQFIDFASRGIV